MSFYSSLNSNSLDLETPTIFEIISAKELANLLTPSLRYVLVHYTYKYPNYLLKIYKYFNEINLVGRGVLELYFLKKYNCTLTEKFYGIKRNFKKLTNLQIIGSLACLLGFPYIKDHLDSVYEKLKIEHTINREDQASRHKANTTFHKLKCWLLLKLYPKLMILIKFAQIYLQVRYISNMNNSKYPNLEALIFNMNYRRISPNDTNSSADLQHGNKDSSNRIRPLSLGDSINLRYYRHIKILASTIFDNVFDKFLPIIMFSLKFLEWWQLNENMQKILNTNSTFIKDCLQKFNRVPHPATNEKLMQNIKPKYLNHEYKKCGICHDSIKDPTIMETGYVFCHDCVLNYNRPFCPVTGQKLLLLVPKDGKNVVFFKKLML